jgi:hypothetical protein
MINVLSNDYFTQGYAGAGVITSVEIIDGSGQVSIQNGRVVVFDPAAAGAYSITVTDTGDAGPPTAAGTPTQNATRAANQQLQITWQAEDLLLRVAGDLALVPGGQSWGGIFNALAIVIFLLNNIRAVVSRS